MRSLNVPLWCTTEPFRNSAYAHHALHLCVRETANECVGFDLGLLTGDLGKSSSHSKFHFNDI